MIRSGVDAGNNYSAFRPLLQMEVRLGVAGTPWPWLYWLHRGTGLFCKASKAASSGHLPPPADTHLCTGICALQGCSSCTDLGAAALPGARGRLFPSDGQKRAAQVGPDTRGLKPAAPPSPLPRGTGRDGAGVAGPSAAPRHGHRPAPGPAEEPRRLAQG